MSKSRKNPERNKNLKSYKNRIQTEKQIKNKINTIMSERTQQSNQPVGMPEIRQSPVWKSDEMLEITGAEWETLFNFVENSSAAFMAANAVMSRNIINGKVKLKFEKLNKESFMYEDMTSEEEAPYQAEVQKAIDAAVKAVSQSNSAIVTSEEIEAESAEIFTPPSQEGLPVLDGLVDANGTPLTTTEKPDLRVV
jgi:hypothetical protein